MKEKLYYNENGVFAVPPKRGKYEVIKRPLFYKLSNLEIADFLDQFATLTSSNINFRVFLLHMIPNETSKKMKWVLANLFYYLDRENLDFAKAVEKTDAFPPFVIALLNQGSSSTMSDIMREGRTYYVNKNKFNKEIMEQLIPPLITLSFAFLLLFAGVFFFIPRLMSEFKEVFGGAMDMEQLPPITRFMMKLSDPTVSFTSLAVFILLIVVSFFLYRKYQKGKFPLLDYILDKIPIVGKLLNFMRYYEFFVVAEFFRKAGSVLNGLRVIKQLTTSAITKNILSYLLKKVDEGEDLFLALAKHPKTPKKLKATLTSSVIGLDEEFIINFGKKVSRAGMQAQFRKLTLLSSFLPVIIVGFLVLLLIVGVYIGPMQTIMSHLGGP